MGIAPAVDVAQVIENSKLVFSTDTITQEEMDGWVRDVGALAGEHVYWMWAPGGGAMHLLTTGNFARVKDAVLSLRARHDAMYRRRCKAMTVNRRRLHTDAQIEKMLASVWEISS